MIKSQETNQNSCRGNEGRWWGEDFGLMFDWLPVLYRHASLASLSDFDHRVEWVQPAIMNSSLINRELTNSKKRKEEINTKHNLFSLPTVMQSAYSKDKWRLLTPVMSFPMCTYQLLSATRPLSMRTRSHSSHHKLDKRKLNISRLVVYLSVINCYQAILIYYFVNLTKHKAARNPKYQKNNTVTCWNFTFFSHNRSKLLS